MCATLLVQCCSIHWLYMVYDKKIQQLVKVCVTLIRQHASLLWFTSGFVQRVYFGTFCQTRCTFYQMHRNLANVAKSAAILGLCTLQDGVLCRSHQSAVHVVGDK